MGPVSGPHGPLRRPVVLGYTAGIFDVFHMGHLNLLRRARERCDHLVVAVTTDEQAKLQNGAPPVIEFVERMAIVQSVRYVDHVLPQVTRDKLLAWQQVRFDLLFAGDVVRGTGDWPETEAALAAVGVRVEYLPATYSRTGDLLSRGLEDLVAD